MLLHLQKCSLLPRRVAIDFAGGGTSSGESGRSSGRTSSRGSLMWTQVVCLGQAEHEAMAHGDTLIAVPRRRDRLCRSKHKQRRKLRKPEHAANQSRLSPLLTIDTSLHFNM